MMAPVWAKIWAIFKNIGSSRKYFDFGGETAIVLHIPLLSKNHRPTLFFANAVFMVSCVRTGKQKRTSTVLSFKMLLDRWIRILQQIFQLYRFWKMQVFQKSYLVSFLKKQTWYIFEKFSISVSFCHNFALIWWQKGEIKNRRTLNSFDIWFYLWASQRKKRSQWVYDFPSILHMGGRKKLAKSSWLERPVSTPCGIQDAMKRPASKAPHQSGFEQKYLCC